MNPEELSRVVVIGTSGAGKTTFARELSSILGCPHVELDALYWGANWTEVADDVFRERVQAATAGNRWVVDGDYARATDLVWPKLTAVIWLNLGFARVFSRGGESAHFGVILYPRGALGWETEKASEACWTGIGIPWWVIRTVSWRRRRAYATAHPTPE